MRLFMSRLHGFAEGCRRAGQDANENVGQEGEAPAKLVGGFKAAQQELRPPGVGLVFVCRVVRKMKSHNGVETPKFPS